jgi:hypothetical protein
MTFYILSISGLPLAVEESKADLYRTFAEVSKKLGLINAPKERAVYTGMKGADHYLPGGIRQLKTGQPVLVCFSTITKTHTDEEAEQETV